MPHLGARNRRPHHNARPERPGMHKQHSRPRNWLRHCKSLQRRDTDRHSHTGCEKRPQGETCTPSQNSRTRLECSRSRSKYRPRKSHWHTDCLLSKSPRLSSCTQRLRSHKSIPSGTSPQSPTNLRYNLDVAPALSSTELHQVNIRHRRHRRYRRKDMDLRPTSRRRCMSLSESCFRYGNVLQDQRSCIQHKAPRGLVLRPRYTVPNSRYYTPVYQPDSWNGSLPRIAPTEFLLRPPNMAVGRQGCTPDIPNRRRSAPLRCRPGSNTPNWPRPNGPRSYLRGIRRLSHKALQD